MDVTRILQTDIKTLVTSWTTMKEEAKDLGTTYWTTAANTIVSGLGDSDAATSSTHLIKTEFVNGITLCDALDKFFSNQAVAQTDYLQLCNKVKYGSAVTPTKRSDVVESLGERMYQVAVDCVEIFKQCRVILEIYTNQEVGDMIANLDSQRTIPGSEMTKDQLSGGITVVEQFKKMINNEVVTTGDYAATLAKWIIL